MMRIKERMQSDKAAMSTSETLILIGLAVFAALALFTFVLRPVQNSADSLGQGIDSGIHGILSSGGENIESVIQGFNKGSVNTPGTQ